jgi:hypothetical protein
MFFFLIWFLGVAAAQQSPSVPFEYMPHCIQLDFSWCSVTQWHMTRLLLLLPLSVASHSGLHIFCNRYNIIKQPCMLIHWQCPVCRHLTYCWFCCFAESEGRGSTLDTLPEEKSTNTQYKRVYSDWRPTIEKTDVVGAMEAIEGGSYTGSRDCSDQLVSGAGQAPPSASLSIGSTWNIFVMRINKRTSKVFV